MVEMPEPFRSIPPLFISQVSNLALGIEHLHQRCPLVEQRKQDISVPAGKDAESTIPVEAALPFCHYPLVEIAHQHMVEGGGHTLYDGNIKVLPLAGSVT